MGGSDPDCSPEEGRGRVRGRFCGRCCLRRLRQRQRRMLWRLRPPPLRWRLRLLLRLPLRRRWRMRGELRRSGKTEWEVGPKTTQLDVRFPKQCTDWSAFFSERRRLGGDDAAGRIAAHRGREAGDAAARASGMRKRQAGTCCQCPMIGRRWKREAASAGAGRPCSAHAAADTARASSSATHLAFGEPEAASLRCEKGIVQSKTPQRR